RRNFLKLTGLGLVGGLAHQAFAADPLSLPDGKLYTKRHWKRFNMSGYAAPKLEKVRVGIIGLGRGMAHLKSVSKLEHVEIMGICDLIPRKIENAQRALEGSGNNPKVYTGDEEAWKALC